MPQTPEERYEYYMNLLKQDPVAAGTQFLDYMRREPKKNARLIHDIQDLERILSGDESAWQYPSRSMADAITFIISNVLARKMGFGVLKIQREDVVSTVAKLISEDVDFLPFTTEQRRMKMLFESYGFVVYRLAEDGSDGPDDARPRFSVASRGRGRDRMFTAVWDETTPPTEAKGETKEIAVANLETKLKEICRAKGWNTDEPPLEISQDKIVCGGFTVGHIEEGYGVATPRLAEDNYDYGGNQWGTEVEYELEDVTDRALGPHPFFVRFVIGGNYDEGDYTVGVRGGWEWQVVKILDAHPYDEDGEPIPFRITPDFENRLEEVIERNLRQEPGFVSDMLERKAADDWGGP